MKLKGLSDKAFKRIALSIKPNHLISLWYENDDGDKWIPPDSYNGYKPPPDGFKYQWSRFPNMLREDCLEIDESGSHQVMSGEMSFQEDLVIAIVKSGDYDLSNEEWEECNTECQFCEE